MKGPYLYKLKQNTFLYQVEFWYKKIKKTETIIEDIKKST